MEELFFSQVLWKDTVVSLFLCEEIAHDLHIKILKGWGNGSLDRAHVVQAEVPEFWILGTHIKIWVWLHTPIIPVLGRRY